MRGSVSIRIGGLAPLSPPGWTAAGRHLIAGLELAVRATNDGGGISGTPIELIVRDTAADPKRAVAAVDELAALGVTTLAGEYHSVVARAVADRAVAIGLPFLCSSAVLDALTSESTDWVARLSPPQSRGWWLYAEFLQRRGHKHIAVAKQSSIYWETGIRIFRDYLAQYGGSVTEFDCDELTPAAVRTKLFDSGASALVLLTGFPEPAVSLVGALRHGRRRGNVLIGAPAGQPEFSEWADALGEDGAAIPFLRYLPESLSAIGSSVQLSLRGELGEAPSFVAYEGYDTILVLVEMLRAGAIHDGRAAAWRTVSVEGTRGHIRFNRPLGSNIWQWSSPPIQIAERDPADFQSFRTVHSA